MTDFFKKKNTKAEQGRVGEIISIDRAFQISSKSRTPTGSWLVPVYFV